MIDTSSAKGTAPEAFLWRDAVRYRAPILHPYHHCDRAAEYGSIHEETEIYAEIMAVPH